MFWGTLARDRRLSGAFAARYGGQVLQYVVIAAWLDAKERSGCILLQSAGRSWTIVVTRRALLNVDTPPRATKERLLQHLDTFCEIALALIGDCPDDRETLLVTATDVRNRRSAYLVPEPLWTWQDKWSPWKQKGSRS